MFLKTNITKHRMPLYAGFDIGIKNLAYCIIDSAKWKRFQKDGGDGDPGILAWENLNLLGEPPVCCALVRKTGAVCGKKAAWSVEECYYCGTHKPKDPDSDVYPYKAPLIKNLNMASFKKQAFHELDKIHLFNQVKYIVIESQPRKNQMMKMFAAAIDAYFLIRQQLDRPDTAVLVSISNSPAKHKLSMYDGPFISASHIKNLYDRRKWLAEQHTKYFLRTAPNVLEQYFVGAKLDDLADSFLHCILAITKRKK